MKNNKLAAILAAATMISVLASCGDTAGNADQTKETNTAAASADTAEPSIYDVLQDNDYGGYTFRILNNLSNVAYINMGEAGQTGESLDDVIYQRNEKTAETLNIQFQIENREYYDTTETVSRVVSAGDDVYYMYTLDLSFMAGHATNGYLLNILDIESIDLENPWWNKTAIDSVTIGDYVYSLFGDLHVGYYEAFYPAVFNKSILNELSLDDPYQLVRDGKWTLDVMLEMIAAAKSDLDGDGKWTTSDRYGFSIYEENGSICLLFTSNETIFEKDKDNLPVWNGLSDRFLTTYDKLVSTAFSVKHNNARSCAGEVAGSTLEKHRAMMHSGHSLFLFEPLGAVKNLRDVDYEIGIVPMPKFDEAQKDYRTYIFASANALAIPVTNPDPERTGVILEHMAAYSHETVRKVFFDETLDFKYVQDEEGQEMLDIMFSGGAFELAAVYNWGGIHGKILQRLNAGKNDVVSQVEKLVSKAEADMETTVDVFRNIGS